MFHPPIILKIFIHYTPNCNYVPLVMPSVPSESVLNGRSPVGVSPFNCKTLSLSLLKRKTRRVCYLTMYSKHWFSVVYRMQHLSCISSNIILDSTRNCKQCNQTTTNIYVRNLDDWKLVGPLFLISRLFCAFSSKKWWPKFLPVVWRLLYQYRASRC